MGYRDAQTETLELRITGILRDGSTVTHEIRINATTGEMQPLKIGRSGMLAPPLFWQQLRVDNDLTDQQSECVARSLAG